MATERGWKEATTTCPKCSGTNKVVVFGGNGSVINESVKCATCDELYSAEITLTFTASVANFEHTAP
jgi:Zn ribbon nucleic-acid-binding protein